MPDIDLGVSVGHAFLNCYMLMYTLFVPGILSLLLALTPSLWNPSRWTEWWNIIMLSSGMFGVVDFEQILGSRERCMNCTETRAAVLTSEASVSGLYGPGAYLAWLLTAWVVAISSIAHAKCAPTNPHRKDIDLELVGVIAYPLIACMDIIVRLARCKIDASLTAAVFVVVASLTILSPIKRLSVQNEDSGLLDSDEIWKSLSEDKRLLMLRVPRWIGYGILLAIIEEPYANVIALLTLWSLLFFVMLYSSLMGEEKYIAGSFTGIGGAYVRGRLISPCRPWWERVLVFCLVQMVYYTVLATTKTRNIWPASSASLWDLDQITTLLLAVVTLIVSRRTALRSYLARRLREIGRFKARISGRIPDGEAILLEALSGDPD